MSNYKMWYSSSNNKPSYKITTSTGGVIQNMGGASNNIILPPSNNNTALGLPTAPSQNPWDKTTRNLTWDQVWTDITSIPSFYASQIDKLTSVPSQIVNTGSKTVTGLGQNVVDLGTNVSNNLSTPLTIGLAVGGVVLVLILLKK